MDKYKVIDARQNPNLQWERNEREFNTLDDAMDYMRKCIKVYEDTCKEYGAFTMWDYGRVVGSAFGYRHETWLEIA